MRIGGRGKEEIIAYKLNYIVLWIVSITIIRMQVTAAIAAATYLRDEGLGKEHHGIWRSL